MKVWIVMGHYKNTDLDIEGEYPKKVFKSLEDALEYTEKKNGTTNMDPNTCIPSWISIAADSEHKESLYVYLDGFEVC